MAAGKKFWQFWKKKNGDSPDPASAVGSSQTLADIVRGMQHAVNTAQQILQQHWRDTLDPYFDDATGEPVTEKYKLPSGHIIEMPLIALVQPQGLALDHMEIEMSVRIDQAEVKPHRSVSEPESSLHRTSFKCSIAPSKNKEDRAMNAVMVKMVFKSGDPPEAVARLIEEFTNSVTPRKEPGSSAPEPLAPPPVPPPALPPASPRAGSE
jgi:DNA-binding protein Fis